jgi:hypothetical protein
MVLREQSFIRKKNVTAAFRNGGISLKMDTGRTMQWSVSPEVSGHVTELLFQYGLIELGQEEETRGDKEEPDIDGYVPKS